MSKEILKDKIPVDTAILQAPVMIPGTGKTETTLNHTKIPGVQMVWLRGEGLLLTVKGIESFIPSTNVKIAHFKKE